MRPLPSSLLLAILRRLPSSCGSISRVLAFPRIVFDLLLAPVLMTFSVLASLLLPVQAHAQLSGAAQADYSYQRTMSRIVGGSAAGLQMSSNSTMDILNGGRKVGSIALKEKRLMDLATLGARAVTLPGMIALGATVLLDYGLQKCADGTLCKPGTGEQAPNGKPYPSSKNYWTSDGLHFADPVSACTNAAAIGGASLKRQYVYRSYYLVGNGNAVGCIVDWVDIQPPRTNIDIGSVVQSGAGCAQGDTAQVSTGMCLPPGYSAGTPPTPATTDEINQAWQRAMQAKPYLQQQTWGFEDQTQQNAEWAAAMAQLAEVVGTGTVQDVQPTTTTTAADGKVTKKQTTCTYTGTANPDMATAKDSPLNVGKKCVTTTTNPDGTTTTEMTEEATSPATGKTPEKIDIETCGLPNKPACKIDETGTKAQSDVDAELQARTAEMDSRLSGVQQAATEALSSVDQKHDSVHIFTLFNVFPTFASETCENPQVPGVVGGMLPVDICTYYYLLKDVMAFGVALFVLVDSVQVVREAVKV